ncbi:MAG: DUF6515 family protein [Cyanobacteriota bacterium]|nr:DUF6515 family protein [Cyanobacteriota bacterium]
MKSSQVFPSLGLISLIAFTLLATPHPAEAAPRVIVGPAGNAIVIAPGLRTGTIVRTLPVGYRVVTVAGKTYYVYNGVYFNYFPARGYVVVNPF